MNVHLWMEVGWSQLATVIVVPHDIPLALVGLTMLAQSRTSDMPTQTLRFDGQKERDM